MYYFIKDHNLLSSINYLLISFIGICLGLCVTMLCNKMRKKNLEARKKSDIQEADEFKHENIEIYETLLNNLWKNKKREYFSYKLSIYLIIIYIILNIISFVLKGQIFNNNVICIFYNIYWMILLIVLINTYNFLIDKKEWKFLQIKKTISFTDKYVLENNEKIRLVVSSNEDESWQFLSGRQLNTEDGRVVSLGEIINKYPLYEVMYILPKGYVISNTYFGNGIIGLADASEFYFDKDYNYLSNEEFIKLILTAINPSRYNIKLGNKRIIEEKVNEISKYINE